MKADEPVGSRCHGYLNGTLSGRKLPELVQMVTDDRKHGVMSPGIPALLECDCASIENVTRGGWFPAETAGWIDVGDAPPSKVRG